MKYFNYSVKNAFRTIKNKKLLTFLMIILITCSLSTFGVLISQGKNINQKTTDYSDTYGKQTYYFTADGMTDLQYYEYVSDNVTDGYDKLLFFHQLLLKEKRIKYIDLIEQPVEIYGTEISDIFLDGYETGEAEYSIFDMDGENWYRTKSLQVSESFFNHFKIKTAFGRKFMEEDYLYQKEKKIPVIIGNEYKKYFQIGDSIHCNYLSDDITLEIVGILDSEQFFYDENEKEFKSCDRYIILPSMSSETVQYSDKIRLLLQLNGTIVSDLGYPKIKEIYEELIKESHIEEYKMYLEDPELAKETINLFEEYSSMTKEVSKQFKIIITILIIFVIISISNVLCGWMNDKKREYGIYLLCGAKNIQIMGYILFLNFFILFTGTAGSLLFLNIYKYPQSSMILVMLMSSLICFLIMINLYINFTKMDISEVIGGKE